MKNETLRSKLRGERQKLSALSWPERFRYIWDYYKPLMAVLLCIILAVSLGVTIYQSARMERVLNVFMIDSDGIRADTEGLAAGFGEYIGGLEKNQEIMVDAGMTLGEDAAGAYAMANQMKLTAAITSGDADVLLFDREGYESYRKLGGFRDLRGILPEERLKAWEDRLVYDHLEMAGETEEMSEAAQTEAVSGELVPVALRLDDSELLQAYEVYPDGEVYGLILEKGAHADTGMLFFDYLLQNTEDKEQSRTTENGEEQK